MKIENMVRLKEEFDYKSLCRRLDMELDKLIAENERQGRLILEQEEALHAKLDEAWNCANEAERKLANALETMEIEKEKLERERLEILQNLERERTERLRIENELTMAIQCTGQQKELPDSSKELADEILELKLQLENERQLRQEAERELQGLRSGFSKNNHVSIEGQEFRMLSIRLEDETRQRRKLEDEIEQLRSQLDQMSFGIDEGRKMTERATSGGLFASESRRITLDANTNFEITTAQRLTATKPHDHVGLQKVLSLLESEEIDIRVHAVKVVANLAAEEKNQEKIVEAGGLHSMLVLLNCSEDETIRRVAAGAVANLAMNETNQELIMSEGGIILLSKTADDAEDPQTLRMVAGAIANLCGNDKLQLKLRDEGGIRALLNMVKSGHPDVLAQVARGIANFAKCESRGAAQGSRRGRSLLIDEGALPWIVANANNEASSIRRHIELAICHLAQQDANAKDLVAGGALRELVRISKECSREDIRTLAYRMLNGNAVFLAELRRLHITL